MFFNIPQGPAAAYQRGCVMFFTMLLFELLPFCYVSFYSWDRKFFLADRESGIYATSAYYVAHMCASESRLAAAQSSECLHDAAHIQLRYPVSSIDLMCLHGVAPRVAS